MKNKVFILLLSGIVAICFTLLPSCRKSAFPRDPYRGASMQKGSYVEKRDKAKYTRSYRHVRVKRTY